MILGSVSVIFRYIKALFKSIFTHIHNFSIPGIFRTLTYSKVRRYLDLCEAYWKIVPSIFPGLSFLDHFRWYIHIILKVFTKAQSWTFDAVLNAPLFYRCSLTSRVALRIFIVISDIFRHIQDLFNHVYSC